MKIHQVVNLKDKETGKYTGYFFCHADGCDFAGILEDAIKHTTANQFIVEYKPQKIKSSWAKSNKDKYSSHEYMDPY